MPKLVKEKRRPMPSTILPVNLKGKYNYYQNYKIKSVRDERLLDLNHFFDPDEQEQAFHRFLENPDYDPEKQWIIEKEPEFKDLVEFSNMNCMEKFCGVLVCMCVEEQDKEEVFNFNLKVVLYFNNVIDRYKEICRQKKKKYKSIKRGSFQIHVENQIQARWILFLPDEETLNEFILCCNLLRLRSFKNQFPNIQINFLKNILFGRDYFGYLNRNYSKNFVYLPEKQIKIIYADF